MSKGGQKDFRESFSSMATQAVIDRSELALLLSTSIGAISQMAYRGELPTTAFPGKRRACWFVGDVRRWLDDISGSRSQKCTSENLSIPTGPEKRIGRPRLSTKK